MAYGLRVWDASGTLTVDISSNLSRVLGVLHIAANADDGSISVPDFAQGTPWSNSSAETYTGEDTWADTYIPFITISGTTLSWSFPASTHKPACYVVYGVS